MLLLHFGIKPYLVFDGAPLPMKQAAHEERKARREKAFKEAQKLIKQGNRKAAVDHLKKSLEITLDVVQQVAKVRVLSDVAWFICSSKSIDLDWQRLPLLGCSIWSWRSTDFPDGHEEDQRSDHWRFGLACLWLWHDHFQTQQSDWSRRSSEKQRPCQDPWVPRLDSRTIPTHVYPFWMWLPTLFAFHWYQGCQADAYCPRRYWKALAVPAAHWQNEEQTNLRWWLPQGKRNLPVPNRIRSWPKRGCPSERSPKYHWMPWQHQSEYPQTYPRYHPS